MDGKFKIVIAGTEYNPIDKTNIQRMIELGRNNANKMNNLFKKYFGLDPHNRYMGSFPYPDKDTGACRVEHCLSMGSVDMRNAIVACLRAAISNAGISDITIIKEDKISGRWPAEMSIVAMGYSITNNLIGEQRIQLSLAALETWLTC